MTGRLFLGAARLVAVAVGVLFAAAFVYALSISWLALVLLICPAVVLLASLLFYG